MRAAVLVVALILAGCGDRRTFDQRYDDTQAKLDKKAKQLDANLAANETAPD